MDRIEIPIFEDGGLWKNPLVIGEGWRQFRVGTCKGAYRSTKDAYEILAIDNMDHEGNGHVEAALDWFFLSCVRDQKDLLIKEVFNKRLAAKLARLGFTCKIKDDYIKRHKEMK